MENPILLIGLASAILTEVVKLVPYITVSDSRKRITAFVIAFALSVGYTLTLEEFAGAELATILVGSASVSYVIYKAIIQTGKDVLATGVAGAKAMMK